MLLIRRLRFSVRVFASVFTLASAILVVPNGTAADITTAMVAHYRLDGDAIDATGRGNDGLLMGPVAVADRFGDPTGALGFDGVDDLVEIADTPDLNFNQPLTLTAWIVRDSSSSGGIVGQWGEGGEGGDSFLFYVSDARLYAAFTEPGLVRVSDPQPIVSGSWRFVAITYDGVAVQFYRNGLPGASHPISAPPIDSWQPVRIGLENIEFGVLDFFDGAIDDVRIYNRALSSEDIEELSNLLFQDGFELNDTSAWSASR